MRSRDFVRLLFAALVVAAAVPVASSYLSAPARGSTDGHPTYDAGPRDGITVVATDSNAWLAGSDSWLGKLGGGPRAKAELIAFAPDGSVLYYNDSHTRYWDVDPVKGTSETVMYVAADHLSKDECHAETVCTRDVVERANLSTGEVTRLYSRVTPYKHSTRWHDVDRLDSQHLVVADIARDRVYVVNTTSDLVEWSWDAQSRYPLAGGGPYPRDWTHINDVEVLQNGTIMVSVRNQDQVVFLNRTTGLQGSMTLGADDRHSVLYEQHNPDYINASNGGPAVVVADSENDRVVEYQREHGAWNRSWVWTDARMRWPRDADRLPNGHTLITDSNGNRVFEVNESGDVVWSVDVAFPYEAERLNTGDESTNGPSAASAGLQSRGGDRGGDGSGGVARANAGTGSGPSLLQTAWHRVARLLPGKVVNAIVYVTPVWMGGPDVLALAIGVLALLAWLLAEAYWSPWRVSVHRPMSISRRR